MKYKNVNTGAVYDSIMPLSHPWVPFAEAPAQAPPETKEPVKEEVPKLKKRKPSSRATKS